MKADAEVHAARAAFPAIHDPSGSRKSRKADAEVHAARAAFLAVSGEGFRPCVGRCQETDTVSPTFWRRPFSKRGFRPAESLQSEYSRLINGFDGRVGVCAVEGTARVCVNGGRHFAMQSVMKLLVGLAVMDVVDHRGWSLDDPVTIRRENLSLYVQPIADIIAAQGSFKTTIGDLVRRAIVDSDSAATDILVERLGGPPAVQAFLGRKGISGIRFDRDEKRLQTEIVGLTWKPEFVDAALLDRAIKQVPPDRRDAENRRYQTDLRDTATPLGMAMMLDSLAGGRLLSGASTRYILDVMSQTVTFPDRLKAGVSAGWTIAHKTGTSGTWRGMTIATNDVGILTAPGGGRIEIAVFIADSHAPERDRAALTARLARAAISHYRPNTPLR